MILILKTVIIVLFFLDIISQSRFIDNMARQELYELSEVRAHT